MFKQTEAQKGQVSYKDTANPQAAVWIKSKETRKSLNGVSVPNVRTEIVINNDVDISTGGSTMVDRVAIRIAISASPYSAAKVKAMLKGLATALPDVADAEVTQGFITLSDPTILNPITA